MLRIPAAISLLLRLAALVVDRVVFSKDSLSVSCEYLRSTLSLGIR
jgi:hypothetical protein